MPSPLLLSLNIPFCPVRCAHCDKQNDVIGDDALPDRYVDALYREAEAAAHAYDDCVIRAVCVGGGIAGHLFDEKLGELLHALHGWFRFAPDAEVSLNIHPGMFSTETLAAMQRGGVNRLNIEYISANAAECEPLERFLPPEAMRITNLVLANSDAVRSFDVLIGLPGQTSVTLRQTLDQALAYEARHFSLSSLRITPGTRFAERWVKQHAHSTSPRYHLPSEQERAALIAYAGEWMSRHGFSEYLPGKFALPGCRSVYLMGQSKSMPEIAFGAGACSRMDGVISCNIRSVEKYCQVSPDPVRLTAFARSWVIT